MADKLSLEQLKVYHKRPMFQVVLVGFCTFCTVGMFSACSALGAGGTQDITLSNIANAVLYGCFCIAGFFSGSVTNLLGIRITLFIGALGYILYVGGLWCFQTQQTRWFLILAGGILGVTAAMFWSAQGVVMMSYPLEKDKGRAFGIFWGIFQSGTLIGSIVAFAININRGGLDSVSTSTYIAFMVIMALGAVCSTLLLPPSKVLRKDGSVPKTEEHAQITVKEEIKGFLSLVKDWRMLTLLPMFFASNYFYAYQNAIAVSLRALNGILTGAGAISGALFLGFVLDVKGLNRKQRGWLGLGTTVIATLLVYLLGLGYQLTFTRETAPDPKYNYKDTANFAIPAALQFFYYFVDAMYQALAYWIMGAITNNSFRLARYAGFYKAIQSAGSAGSFGMDAELTPFLNEHLASFCMMLVSFPLFAIVLRSVRVSGSAVEEDRLEEMEQRDAGAISKDEFRGDVESSNRTVQ